MIVRAQKPAPLAGTGKRRFAGYAPEDEIKQGQLTVSHDEGLSILMASYARICSRELNFDFAIKSTGNTKEDEPSRRYGHGARVGTKVKPSARQIESFAILLDEFKEKNGFQDDSGAEDIAGPFISALMNESPDNSFSLNFTNGPVLPFIGLRNRKIIRIFGDVKLCVGKDMQAGEIILEGNAAGLAGMGMKGGRIVIKGDAGEGAGQSMSGGRIIIEGNAGQDLGNLMDGGEIIVHGNGMSGTIFKGTISILGKKRKKMAHAR